MTCACQHVLAAHTASAPATLCSAGPVNPGSHPESRPVTSSQLPCGHRCDPGATLASLKEGDSLGHNGGNHGLSPASRGPPARRHRASEASLSCLRPVWVKSKHLRWHLAASTACVQWVPLGLELVCSILSALSDTESITSS